MQPTGTKFEKFGIEWEIISTNNELYYTCSSTSLIKSWRDFTEKELEGVKFYE